MSEKASEARMDALMETRRDELKRLLPLVAGPYGSVKARWRTAARKLGWKVSQVKDAWYGDARRWWDEHHVQQAKKAAKEAGQADGEDELQRLKADVADLQATIRTLLARLDGPPASQAQ